MPVINFLARLLLRWEVSLYLSGGQIIRFRCRKFNIEYSRGNLRLNSLQTEGAVGFPFHTVLEDVSAITSRRVLV